LILPAQNQFYFPWLLLFVHSKLLSHSNQMHILIFSTVSIHKLKCFADRPTEYICVIRANRLHYLPSIYFGKWPLHDSSRVTAHHQEVLFCMYSNCLCHAFMLAGC
jgi:hypothetical protein